MAKSHAIETVIVTANRRRENLQNVPIAVTALSAKSLSSSGVTNVQDLDIVVPGLNVQQDDGFEVTHLRGVGSTLLGPGLESPIALYVDGVYFASTSSSLIDFVDVSDVQVLKGPQGTLFGRNATGGLIQVTTKPPSQDPHVDIDFSYGNYDTSKMDAYVTGGITDTLAASFAMQLTHQGDGYGTNHANGEPVYRDDFDGAFRSSWLYTPSDETKLLAIFDFSQTRNSDNPFTLQPGTIADPASETYKFSNPWDTNDNVQPLVYTKGGGGSVRLDQDLGFARLMDLVAFRDSATRLDFDLDVTPLPVESASLLDQERQFSDEVQLQSEPGSAVKWTTGLYYLNAKGQYLPNSAVFLGTSETLGLVGAETTQSLAGYGQATVQILPRTNLTGGFRYTYERRSLSASQELIIGDLVIPLPGADKAKEYYKPTFRLAIDHRITDQTLIYASYNTGFKSGGFNTQVPTDPAFGPESLKAYEIGAKNEFLDHRLRINLAGFYYNYQNIQIQHLELASSGVINGPPAVIYGVDLDILARVTDDLTLGGGLEYLHDRFTGPMPPVPTSEVQGDIPEIVASADGHRLPVTPDAVLSLTAAYNFALYGGDSSANVTYEYNSGWFEEPDNAMHQPPFSRVNLSLHWRSPNTRYTADIWAKNLTNAAVWSQGQTQVDGVHDVQFEPPRLYGFTVGYHF